MKSKLLLSYFLVIISIPFSLSAQDFLLQGWYWDYPPDTTGQIWAEVLNSKAQELKDAGFTYVWLPPFCRASSGNYSNGYDPKDLYDLGEYGLGATRFGTREDVDDLISALNSKNIKAVADVVYNHRDGGAPEKNTAVEGWIENMTWQKIQDGDNAYPSDRFRCILSIGGSTGRGTGTYYFKIRSASQHSNFYNRQYKVYMWTDVVGWQELDDANETEPNGGGSEPNTPITLGRNFLANIDALGSGFDEFALTLSSEDFNSSGDNIYIVLSNTSSYSDHYIEELWYNGFNIQSEIEYQTYTDFTNLPSNSGSMNYMNFKPNGNATQLDGDWDWMWFFYDYDQGVQSTRTVLFDWTKWLWNNVGIRGYRMDAVKHFPHSFVGDLLDDLHDNGITPELVVGEFYDSNAGLLKGWIDNVYSTMDNDTKASITPRIFDFSLRQALKDACDTFEYDVRNVFNSSMVDAVGASGFNVITFVGNHDFRDGGQFIANDPILAYAYILTNNQLGLPCVFYKDYYVDGGGLKSQIDALINVHKNYLYGATSRDYLSRKDSPYSQTFSSGYNTTTLIFQVKGTPSGKDVIVAINFAAEELNITQQINSANVLPGVTFTDIIGNSINPTTQLTPENKITINLPARSYAVYVADNPLPVELTSFSYTINNRNVILNWKTATEQNNYGFEIERLQDCKIARLQDSQKDKNLWNVIGFVKGNGNSNSPRDYSFTDTIKTVGNYFYRLKQIDTDGKYEYSAILEVKITLPYGFILEQNFPNPFNPTTTIQFGFEKSEKVELKIFDILGNEIETLFSDIVEPEKIYSIPFNAGQLSSGIYYYRIITQERTVTKKMILLR